MADFKGSVGPRDTNLTKEAVQKLIALRSKLAIDYGGFFRSMMKVYTPKGPIYKELEAGLRLTNAVMFYMDVILGRKGRAATEEEFNLMRQRLDELNAQMEYFSKLYLKSKKFKASVDRLALDTGIALSHLTSVSGELEKEIAEASGKREGIYEQVMRVSPTLKGLVSDIGAGARAAAFGPFTPIAEMAWETISGIRKEKREKRISAERKSWMSRFGPSGMDIAQPTLEEINARRRAGGGTIGDSFGGGIGLGMDPLSDFFNRKAYHANWTKEILASIKRLGGEKEDGMGLGGKIMDMLGFDTIMADITAAFSGLLPVVVGVGAALAGAAGLLGLGHASTAEMESQMGSKAYGKFIGADKLGGMARPLHDIATAGLEVAMPVGGMGMATHDIARRMGAKIPETINPFAYMAGAITNLGATIGSKIAEFMTGAKTPEQVVVPSTGSKTSYRDHDPWQDKINRSDED
jgi:hypothetical protein